MARQLLAVCESGSAKVTLAGLGSSEALTSKSDAIVGGERGLESPSALPKDVVLNMWVATLLGVPYQIFTLWFGTLQHYSLK